MSVTRPSFSKNLFGTWNIAIISPPSGVQADMAAAGFAPDEFAGTDRQALRRALLVDQLALEHVGLLDPDVLVVGQRRARAPTSSAR